MFSLSFSQLEQAALEVHLNFEYNIYLSNLRFLRLAPFCVHFLALQEIKATASQRLNASRYSDCLAFQLRLREWSHSGTEED